MTSVIVAVIARSSCDEAIQFLLCGFWIASWSLSSGAHSRDPLAHNDGGRKPMNIQPKQGAALAHLHGPAVETSRLILRQWQAGDIAPYTAMLADPGTARFITVDGKPVTDEMTGWRHTVVMAGHWAVHGAGMFAVEEKHSGNFVGRVGPWFPPTWPDFEIGWGITREAQGNGYASEAARAAIGWAFATFEIAQVIHCIDRENTASQSVARRLGAEKQKEIELFGHAADIWVTTREGWTAARS
jgi:RimJ/RimL family protein N-acetyltransferase